MFGEVAKAHSGGAISLEDSWVAEQHRDADGQDEGQQPMLCSGGAVRLERPADGV